MRSWSRLSALGVIAGAAVATSCSAPHELDTAAVRDLVTSSVEGATGVSPSLVTCPQLPEIDDGTTFECTAMLDDQAVRVDGVVLDAANSVVEVANADAVIFVELLEATIAFDLFEQLGLALELDCGSTELRVAEPGSTFQCTATDASGDTAIVDVDVVDASGEVDFQLG